MEKKNVANVDNSSDNNWLSNFLANTGGAKLLTGGIFATEAIKKIPDDPSQAAQDLSNAVTGTAERMVGDPISAAGNYMQRGLLMLLAIALIIIGFYFVFKTGALNEV